MSRYSSNPQAKAAPEDPSHLPLLHGRPEQPHQPAITFREEGGPAAHNNCVPKSRTGPCSEITDGREAARPCVDFWGILEGSGGPSQGAECGEANPACSDGWGSRQDAPCSSSSRTSKPPPLAPRAPSRVLGGGRKCCTGCRHDSSGPQWRDWVSGCVGSRGNQCDRGGGWDEMGLMGGWMDAWMDDGRWMMPLSEQGPCIPAASLSSRGQGPGLQCSPKQAPAAPLHPRHVCVWLGGSGLGLDAMAS